MFKRLDDTAKIAIVVVSVTTLLFVAPAFWGTILLMAFGAVWPWTAVSAVCTVGIIFGAWAILYGRVNSHTLLGFDIIISAVILIAGFVINKPDSATLLFVLNLLLMVGHYLLALVTAVGLPAIRELNTLQPETS